MKVITKISKYNNEIITKLVNNKEGNVLNGAFTRKKNMPFEDLITFVIGKKGRTMRVELFDFAKIAEKQPISKQNFSKQRMKILDSYWIKSMYDVARKFYVTCDAKTIGGYHLLAIDGSKLILPRVKELENIYGLANANDGQQKCVQCLLSGCYDVLNDIMLDVQIAPYASDERELAQKNIEAIVKEYPDKKFLIIFDRGYPSIQMMYFMDKLGIKYIIRLQDNTYENEKRTMKTNDEVVDIKINKDRLSGKMSDEIREELKKMGSYKVRFVKCVLSTGNVEWLATNLDSKEFSSSKLKNMYFERWKIEICYDTIKNKLQIENISGKSDLVVKQDIYATFIVKNMIATMARLIESDPESQKIINNKNNKHTYKLNQNTLIGFFKDIFVEFIVTENEKKKEQLLQLLYQEAIRSKTAIIENRSYPRKFKGGSKKCKVNYKRSF